MGRLIEGLWDCPYCSTKSIGGSKRECPNCGKPRGENTRFYMPSKITYVSEEQEDKISRNPDWLCEFCECLNSDSDSICKSCGSVRSVKSKDYFTMKEKETNNIEEISCEKNEFITKSKEFFKNRKKYLLIALSLLIFATGIIVLLIPKTREVTISGFEWERSISIERYQTVNESDWDLPSGGRLKYTQNEIFRYERVLDHYETKSRTVTNQRLVGYEEYVVGHRDLGNGYFEEITDRRPVYESYEDIEYYQ